MNYLRRVLLKAAGLGLLFMTTPLRVLADWNKPAFNTKRYPDALYTLYKDRTIIPSDAITLSISSSVENGAVVPIKIETTLPDTRTIDIFIEKNPNPLIARFKMNPRCHAFVSTRLKFDLPSNVIVIIDSQGHLYKQHTFVEVLEGGCG